MNYLLRTIVMRIENFKDIKNNGKFYTPQNLADYLVRPLINKHELKIFDPSYGEGALLLAAEKVCRQNNINFELYGCDKSPVNGYLNHLDQSKLTKIDFLKFRSSMKYDLIFMNPPFIRHHMISKLEKDIYSKQFSTFYKIIKTSDLWVYFLIKSLTHLAEGGSIGVILPWSFLQSDYSQELRKQLSKLFESIKVIGLTKNYFKETEERVLLIWLHNYGASNKNISIGITSKLSKKIKYQNISQSNWESLYPISYNGYDINNIIKKYIDEYNFERFNEYADVKIGIVTGSNKYFIIDKNIKSKYNINSRNLLPILRNVKEFQGLSFNGYKPINKLLKIQKFKEHRKYLTLGINEGHNLNTHASLRKPWYKIKIGKTPDAFFPYRIKLYPFLALNDSKIQSTNSIHRIYFKDLNERQKKWLQISLLSLPGQLSLEFYSKIYGNGILKIEPRSLKNSLIFVSSLKVSEVIYEKISNAILTNKKGLAVKIATEYINKKLNISDELTEASEYILRDLQNRRLG